MIRHFVMMTFHEATEAAEARDRLEALTGQIPELLSLEVFPDIRRSEGNAHLALVTTHVSLEGLQAYAEHPAHASFRQWVQPRLSGRVVVDAEH